MIRNKVKNRIKNPYNHTWGWCGMCGAHVVCGVCGNNTCNGSSGYIGEDKCIACDSAYKYTETYKDTCPALLRIKDYVFWRIKQPLSSRCRRASKKWYYKNKIVYNLLEGIVEFLIPTPKIFKLKGRKLEKYLYDNYKGK